MALSILNHGPLGEIPEDIPAWIREVSYRVKNEAVTAEGWIDYTHLRKMEYYVLFEQEMRILRVFSLDDLPRREDRLAFWLNVFHLLTVHGILALNIRYSVKEVTGFYGRVAYEIGGLRFSLDDIYHGILRGNRWKHPLARRPFGRRDRRRRFAMETCDPRIHCALVRGTRSSPPWEVYEPEEIDDQLDATTRRFVRATTHVDPIKGTVTMASLFRRYRRDFGQSEADVLRFLLLTVDDAEAQAYLRQNLLVVKVAYTPEDWSLNGV